MKSLYPLVALTATFTTLPAADITWTGATNTWNTAGNWSGTNTPPLSGDNLIFGAPGAGGAALNNDLTTSSFQIGNLTFLNTATTGYTIGNGVDGTVDTSAFTLTGGIVNNSSATHTINSAITLSGATIANITSGNVTLRGTISGSGTLEKTGTGILRIGGPNSTVNTGTITVTAGSLELNKAPNLNQISSNIITNGGTLTWTAGTTNQANQLADTATITIQGGTGNTGGIGSVVIDTVASVTSFGNQSRFNLGSGSNFTITGALSLTGSNGASNANAYSLAANSGGASTLTVGSINLDNAYYQIGQSGGVNNATLNLNGGLTGANTSSINNTTGGAGIRSFVLTGAGAHDHVFNITSGTTTVSANISQTASTTGSLTKTTGTGTLILTGANTYSGGTNINAGTLQAGNASALGTGTVNIGGGNLTTTVTNLGTGSLALTSGSLSLNGTATGTLTLSADSDFTMSGGQWIVALTTADQILGSGAGANFLITGGTLDLGGGAINYGTTYNLLNGFANGSVSGLAITNYDTSNFTANLGNNGVLSFIAVPEPATALLGGLGLLGLLRRRRA